jgi:hypothetical protein
MKDKIFGSSYKLEPAEALMSIKSFKRAAGLTSFLFRQVTVPHAP